MIGTASGSPGNRADGRPPVFPARSAPTPPVYPGRDVVFFMFTPLWAEALFCARIFPMRRSRMVPMAALRFFPQPAWVHPEDQHYLDASLYMLFTIVQLFVDTVVGCAVTRMQANPMVCGS